MFICIYTLQQDALQLDRFTIIALYLLARTSGTCIRHVTYKHVPTVQPNTNTMLLAAVLLAPVAPLLSIVLYDFTYQKVTELLLY